MPRKPERQENYCGFQASQGYIQTILGYRVRPCLKMRGGEGKVEGKMALRLRAHVLLQKAKGYNPKVLAL